MALFPSMFLGLSSRHPSRLVVTTKAGHLISLKGNGGDGLRRMAHNQNGLFDLLIYRLDAQTEFANSIRLEKEPLLRINLFLSYSAKRANSLKINSPVSVVVYVVSPKCLKPLFPFHHSDVAVAPHPGPFVHFYLTSYKQPQ